MKPTGPTNPELRMLIEELRRVSHKQQADIWKRVAKDLQKPTRNRRVVNLSRINRYTQDNDTVVIPGKVLASGSLDHKVNVAAFCFSSSAKDIIARNKGAALSILELVQQNPKGTNVKILG